MRLSTMEKHWDADLYDRSHSFVWKHGAALLELLAPQSGERILDQHFEYLTNARDLLVGRPGTVRRDEIPDGIEIVISLWGFAKPIWHA